MKIRFELPWSFIKGEVMDRLRLRLSEFNIYPNKDQLDDIRLRVENGKIKTIVVDICTKDDAKCKDK